MLILASIFAVGLTACEDKTEEKDKVKENPTTEVKIAGTWGSVDVGVKQYKDGVFDNEIKSTDTLTLVLNTDDSFTYRGRYQVYNEGAYTYSDNKLILNGNTEKRTLDVDTLTQDELRVSYSEEKTEFGVVYRDDYYRVYKRK